MFITEFSWNMIKKLYVAMLLFSLCIQTSNFVFRPWRVLSLHDAQSVYSAAAMSRIFSARHFVLVAGSTNDSSEVVSSGAASILDGPRQTLCRISGVKVWNVTAYLIVLSWKVNICGCQIVLVSAQLSYTFLYQVCFLVFKITPRVLKSDLSHNRQSTHALLQLLTSMLM